MSEELPPTIIGSAGLTGRQQIVRSPELLEEPDSYDADGNPVWPVPRVAAAMPPQCLRKLALPERVGNRETHCFQDCVGRQDDGGCLSDLIRQAKIDQVDYVLEVSYDEYGEQHWTFNR